MVEPKINIFDNIQQSVTYFTVMQTSRIFKDLSGFKMPHFEDYFHTMTLGTSNCWTVNMKILTRTVQTKANGNFGKENVKKQSFV